MPGKQTVHVDISVLFSDSETAEEEWSEEGYEGSGCSEIHAQDHTAKL